MTDVDMVDADSTAKDQVAPRKSATSHGTTLAEGQKKFEVKKVWAALAVRQARTDVRQWNAVALWAWDIVVDNCAICRNHIMDLCKLHSLVLRCYLMLIRSSLQASNVKLIKPLPRVRSARSPGVSAM
jgi:hypothetical protein